MNKVIYGFRNSEGCSSKIFEDVEIAKTILDNKFISSTENAVIKGLIQEIRLHKFGYLLYTEKQVNTLIN